MTNPANPLIGRRVRYTINDQLQFEGIAIDSFYAPDYYRVVIEVRVHPTMPDAIGLVVVVPIGLLPRAGHHRDTHRVCTLPDDPGSVPDSKDA